MTIGRLVLDVGGVDGNTTGLLFRGLVDLRVVGELGGTILGEHTGDGSGQRCLSVVDVTWQAE